MSLQVWLPLTKDLRQQGLSNISVTNNGATYSSTGGKLGGCYSFNRSTPTYLKVDNPLTTIENGVSMAFWVKLPSNASGNNQIIHIGNGAGWGHNRCTVFVRSGTSYLVFSLSGGSDSTSTQYTLVSSSLTLNTWTHVVCTYSAGKAKIYLNGVLDHEYTVSITPSFNSTPYIGIGAAPNAAEGVTCSINDVRIYDHCLSEKEIKYISQGLVLHYLLDRRGFGQENFILESHKVTSGGNANGITRTYESDGSIKIVSTSGNGNYASLGFAQNSNTSVGNNMVVGDTYCISCDVKIETGTALPTLFINSGNGYKQLKSVNGSIITNKWMRAYYTSTWAEPGTQYGNISLHLGFSNAIGTYYFKNFKLEKGSIPTLWCPNSSDVLATTMDFNSTTEYDCSGFCNNGTRTGTFSWTSDSPKHSVSTYFEDYTKYISCSLGNYIPTVITMSCWIKTSNTSPRGGYHIPFNVHSTDFEISITGSSGKARMGYVVGGTRKVKDIGTNIENGQWHMLTSTYDGTAINRYIDGVLIDTESATGALSTLSTVGVGAFPGGTTYGNTQVYQSDCRIYMTALSADDIAELYAAGRP